MTPPTGSYKTDPHYLSQLDTTPSDLRVLKTSLHSVFKIHEDPHARSLTYTYMKVKTQHNIH